MQDLNRDGEGDRITAVDPAGNSIIMMGCLTFFLMKMTSEMRARLRKLTSHAEVPRN